VTAIDLIAQALNTHRITYRRCHGFGCRCGVEFTRWNEADAHQAQAVTEALGLRESTLLLDDGSAGVWTDADGRMRSVMVPQTQQVRYVTPWKERTDV
jgi:hypothetical protein